MSTTRFVNLTSALTPILLSVLILQLLRKNNGPSSNQKTRTNKLELPPPTGLIGKHFESLDTTHGVILLRQLGLAQIVDSRPKFGTWNNSVTQSVVAVTFRFTPVYVSLDALIEL